MNRKKFLKTLAAGGVVIMGRPLALVRSEVKAGDRPALAADPGSISEKPFGPASGPRGPTLFRIMPSQETGIVSENRYADPAMWAKRYNEFETGSIGTGVAIGDFDRDGLPDLFVVSKTESCRLFRNLGNWKFEDVTEKAGVGDKGEAAAVWKQGATFVDIDNNGLLDIYVCRFGAPNLLYINQGDGTFKEEAAARGLAVSDASVMAAFCDYDRDGHLDVFIQTNLLDAQSHPDGQRDYLFHNNGDGTFTDVSQRAGISGEAQGHSAIWWDYDGDGWPDLYVANDFAQPDRLYHNNRDGTFTDVIDSVVPHMPYSSMGSDLGDLNNDGLVDFFVADMAATTHQKDQRTLAVMRSFPNQRIEPPDGSTAAPQYMRNALYLNTGMGRVMEVSEIAGLSATDWTWSVRLEDLDNDGRIDLFVTNGMNRESHNADMTTRKELAESLDEKVRIERQSPEMPERHLAFRNLGDLRFEETGAAWGLDQRGISFGSAFGDLDGDGDLDLVYANYGGGVTVLRNDSDKGHKIIVELRGTQSNRFGVGSLVRIETQSGVQVRSLVLERGVLSSSEPVLHFGLGEDTLVKTLRVSWPSGQEQVFTNLGVDRRFTVTEPREGSVPAPRSDVPARQFSDISEAAGFSLMTREATVDETAQEPLLPFRQNRRGPALAVGDINGDGLDDLAVGGTPATPARLMIAGADGRLAPGDASFLASEGPLNDGPMLLFDADGDGFNDLLVTRGGNNLPFGSPEYQPRLFLNNGRGGFRAAPQDMLPPLPISAGAVAAADFERSGRLGLFIGGRTRPGQYPLGPRSALLASRGGRFVDVTDKLAPALREVGMVSSALWCDVDGDGWPDLLLAVEWGHVKYFHNDQGTGFSDWTEKSGFAAAGTGWWTSIAAADFNGDGRMDFVVGNVGLNTQYHASPESPALLFYGEFGGGNGPQIVEAYMEGGRLYPWRARRDLGAAIPSILKRFPRNDYYARATLEEILGKERLAAAQRFEATELRSGVFLSQPDGGYQFEPLPRIAQVSPLQGIAAGDMDGDGFADIYAVQNSFAPVACIGRFDGGVSQMLRGDGRGGFAPVPAAESGLMVTGDAKALAVADLDGDGWPDFLVTRNNGTSLALRNNRVRGRNSIRLSLRGRPGNRNAVGARIVLIHANGATQTADIHAGGGYYSQSPACCFFGWTVGNPPKQVQVRWPWGESTTHDFRPGSGSMVVSAE